MPHLPPPPPAGLAPGAVIQVQIIGYPQGHREGPREMVGSEGGHCRRRKASNGTHLFSRIRNNGELSAFLPTTTRRSWGWEGIAGLVRPHGTHGDPGPCRQPRPVDDVRRRPLGLPVPRTDPLPCPRDASTSKGGLSCRSVGNRTRVPLPSLPNPRLSTLHSHPEGWIVMERGGVGILKFVFIAMYVPPP